MSNLNFRILDQERCQKHTPNPELQIYQTEEEKCDAIS